MRIWVTLSFLFLLGSSAHPQEPDRPQQHITFGPDDTQRCLKCHGMANFGFRDSATSSVHSYSVSADVFKASIHAKVHCQQCHSDIKEYPHQFEKTRVKVSCGDECHAVDSTGSKYTHRIVVSEFEHSAHRKGLTSAAEDNPTCTTCHGSGDPHAIARARMSVPPREKMQLCISCHENSPVMAKHSVDPEAVGSYRRSFHYKAIKFGLTTTAVCQDCHAAHKILPKDSLESSISPKNIERTCGKEGCHPGARMNFAMSGANHLALRMEHEPLLRWMEKFFIVLTAGTMAMLLAGIVLDVQRKFGWVLVLGRIVSPLLRNARSVGRLLSTLMKLTRSVLID